MPECNAGFVCVGSGFRKYVVGMHSVFVFVTVDLNGGDRMPFHHLSSDYLCLHNKHCKHLL